jgi:acyl-coenzyme A synthetase/AMP-(fatty) acid ligase
MRGYHRDPARSRGAFADGYFRTGDIARRRSDGRVELIGRMTDIINRGGIKIAPLEIERVFMEHPNVVATLVTGVPDPVRGEAVHVFVVPRAGSRLDAENLIAWAREKLDRSKVPDRIHFGDELPMGRTGKADRVALRSLILAQ